MKNIRREKRSCAKRRLDTVGDADVSTLIDESCVLEDAAGRPLIVYLEIEPTITLAHLSDKLQALKYEKSGRTSGLPSTSRVFGYQPRVTIRRDFCAAASLNRDRSTYNAIGEAAYVATREYERYNPALLENHRAMTKRVLPAWRMADDVPFTSGIINKNNQLRYHFDSGNFPSVWSAMFVFKKDVEGGHLACPEYDLGFELRNNSLLLFDGQSILHGVTPIKLLSPHAFRYSIVYYSLAGMWKCLAPGEEIQRIRKLRVQREQKRSLAK